MSRSINSTRGIGVGSIFKSKTSGDFRVVSIKDKDILVKFINTGHEKVTSISAIINGNLRDNSLPKLVCGVGINDADYVVKVSTKYKLPCGKFKSELIWQCPVYSSWKRMIERVHNEKYLLKRPTYRDVKIQKEWYNFSNFKNWVDSLKYDVMGLVLDKDILSKDYKIYSPETCAFVTSKVNSFVLDFNTVGAKRVRQRTENCFEGRISNPITGKDESFYANNRESCALWAENKRLEIVNQLIETEPDLRVKQALYIKYIDGGTNE